MVNKVKTVLLESFEEVIKKDPIIKTKAKTLTMSYLLGVDHFGVGERIKLGDRLEKWITKLIEMIEDVDAIKPSSKKLWINIESGDLVFGGNGKGLKDVDILFELDGRIIYLEAKTNLELDTEKSVITIEKVNVIVESLKRNPKFSNKKVVGKVLSLFWDDAKVDGLKVPYSSDMKKKSENVMFFSEFSELLGLGLIKEKYYAELLELGKTL
jgi:hypothetical protein